MSNGAPVMSSFVQALRRAARNPHTSTSRWWFRVEGFVSATEHLGVFTLANEVRNEPFVEPPTHTYFRRSTGRLDASFYGGSRPDDNMRLVGTDIGNEWFLRSLASVLRPGDQLLARFVVANNTETLAKADLQHDACFVQVWRGEGAKRRFIIELALDDRIIPVGGLAGVVDRRLYSAADIDRMVAEAYNRELAL